MLSRPDKWIIGVGVSEGSRHARQSGVGGGLRSIRT
jgi:hypothetical protein